MTTQQKDAILHWFKTVSTIVGTMVLLGGLVAGAFGAYYSFEKRTDAEQKRRTMWQAIGRKEEKEDAKEARKAINANLEKYFREQQRANAEILDELKTVRQRTWELVKDR